MIYKIIDKQNQVYFSEEFGSLKEVCDHLINYHEIDIDMSEERKLWNEKKYEECWGLLTIYDWELEEIEKPIENDFDIFTTNYGTHDTWGLPDKVNERNQEICEWVNSKAGCNIAWVKVNEHDFGPYESLEIYVPAEHIKGKELLEWVEDNPEENETLEEGELKQIEEYEKWLKFIEELESEYCKKWLND